ncbi:MAG: DUF6261 family protein [Chitinispirillia bacterium]|jgi:hypothetical protein
MFTKIGKLLTTNISDASLYQFAEILHNKILEFPEVNDRLTHHVKEVGHAMDLFSDAFHRSRKSPYTRFINEKHRERKNLLTALRRHINAAQKLVSNPAKVSAAQMLKETMKTSNLWIYNNISHSSTSLLISSLLRKFKQKRIEQWVHEVGVEEIIYDLNYIQKNFEALSQKRCDFNSENKKPQQKSARKYLIEAILSLLATIDFKVRHEQKNFCSIATFCSVLIKETNSTTKNSMTREKKEDSKSTANEILGIISDWKPDKKNNP